MGRQNHQDEAAGALRAVILTCPDHPSDAIIQSLTRRGVQTLTVTSDLWAMAHACGTGPGTLVVICEPALLGVRAAQLVLGLRKYAPTAVAYAYTAAGGDLRPVTEQDVVDWGAPGKPEGNGHATPIEPSTLRSPLPRLRLSDHEPRPIGPSLPITEHTAGPSDVLSAEELAMLLGRSGANGGAGSAKGDQR